MRSARFVTRDDVSLPGSGADAATWLAKHAPIAADQSADAI